jgi:thiol-disulfide isomerase/thioredoxin
LLLPPLFLLPLTLALPVSAVRPVDEAALGALLRSTHAGPLMVNFFATWCAPCAAELPLLQTLVLGNPHASALFVSLDGMEDAARVQELATRVGLLSPVVHLQSTDPAAAMVRLVADWPERIPVTMVFSPDGSEAARFVGLVHAQALSAALVPGSVVPGKSAP